MAGEEELKLLGWWASPFVIRVKLALQLKGVSYDYLEEDLKNKSDLLLASNPVHKKVPVLIHNGKPICESLVILQYIDEAFAGTGPSLLPSDPYERAIARFWAAYIDDKLGPALEGICVTAKTEEEKLEKLQETFACIQQLEAAFNECSKGKTFFGGDSVGYLDVALGSSLSYFKATDEMPGVSLLDAGKTPFLAEWAERFGATEAAKDSTPEVGRVVDFARALRASLVVAASK